MDISVKYSLVTRLPLMQGINGQELAAMEDYVQLRMEPAEENETLASQGDDCDSLILLVDGTLKYTATNDKLGMLVSGAVDAPYVVEPYNLYGLLRKYRHSYVCGKECISIRLSRKDVSVLLTRCEIFRINFMNAVCASYQKCLRRMGSVKFASPEAKIRFLLSGELAGCMGESVVKVKMESLAEYVGETRLNVSKTLHDMEERGLVRLARNTIYINDIETFSKQ